MFLYYLPLLFSLTYSQSSTISIGIIDQNEYPNGILNVVIPNVTLCSSSGLKLEIQWIKLSNSLSDLIHQLELRINKTNIYLSRIDNFQTKLIEDFCQTYRIPFINMHSYDNLSPSISSTQKYSVMPNTLRTLISYLKYHHVEKAAYIYDNDESTRRIYELLKLINDDEYFNNFLLDIRTTKYEDIYSLLYSIEIHTMVKDQPPKYILLDLKSYSDYEKMFEKISHMGLTSDLYYYIILSSFDTCLWMKKVNFTGRLIYFDYQQNECKLDYSQSSTLNDKTLSKFKYQTSYYQSTLSFRTDHDQYKSMNSTQFNLHNSSLLSNSSENNDTNINACHNPINLNNNYISYTYFLSQISKSYQLYSRQLYDSINLIIDILNSNSIDCKTLRLKSDKFDRDKLYLSDVNIYTTKKSRSKVNKNPIELIERYSSIQDDYQSCHTDKRKDLSKLQKISTPRIYYITSIFDEPFLMLRKRTELHAKYSQPNANLKELRGQVFDFHELEGYCVDLAERVCSILNITCKFRIVQDGAFGSKNAKTGKWNGMVGEIVSRTADMAIAPLTISHTRMEVVDFSKPFMNLGISIMIRKPDAEKPGVFSFMHPVSMEIWLCFSLAYFAVSVVLFLTSRVVNSGWRRRIVRRPSYRSYSYPKSVNDRRKSEIELHRQKSDSNASEQPSDFTALSPSPKISTRRRHHYRTRQYLPAAFINNNRDKDKKAKKKGEEDDKLKKKDIHLFGISNALFFSFASFMRQSINLVPKSFSGRVAATSWWYFSLIFVSSYTANLVASLTVENLITPIDNVEDLAKQQEIKYGAVRNGTTAAFFEKSNVSVFQHMWAVMQKHSSEVFVATNDEGVAKVRNSKGKYAFFIESTKNEYVNEQLPCDTMKVGSDLDSKGYGITTRLGSELSEAINIIVTNLRELGFLDKLKQSWWYDRSECSQSSKDKRFSELSLSSVTGLFYILLFGIILSCFIAFAEFLITAKTESEKLQIDFREILRIKLIENLVGITINTQRQLEFGRIEHEFNYNYQNEEDEIIQQYTQYQLQKPQSDV